MKTREILLADEKHVTAQLKTMKIKTLERHTKKVLIQLGQSDYDKVMAAAIKAIPHMDTESDRFQILKDLIKAQLPNELLTPDELAVLDRVTVLVMVLVAKKFTKILKEQSTTPTLH